jgi:hypothetical protein
VRRSAEGIVFQEMLQKGFKTRTVVAMDEDSGRGKRKALKMMSRQTVGVEYDAGQAIAQG